MPWVFDREVAAVNWLSPTPASAALRDPQVVILELEGGALVFDELFVKSRYGYEIRCEIVGESGTVELAPTARVAVRSDLKVSRDVPPDFRGRFAEAYRHELQAWVDAISRWRSVNADGYIGPVDGPDAWDGYRVAVISQAVLASMSKNARSVVDFVPMPDLYRQCRAAGTSADQS
jgi:myo-inositol 2-dehydrogenase/D-chiro-inositol 1-dehydrogenase